MVPEKLIRISQQNHKNLQKRQKSFWNHLPVIICWRLTTFDFLNRRNWVARRNRELVFFNNRVVSHFCMHAIIYLIESLLSYGQTTLDRLEGSCLMRTSCENLSIPKLSQIFVNDCLLNSSLISDSRVFIVSLVSCLRLRASLCSFCLLFVRHLLSNSINTFWCISLFKVMLNNS